MSLLVLFLIFDQVCQEMPALNLHCFALIKLLLRVDID
jgi:hypothetical protein